MLISFHFLHPDGGFHGSLNQTICFHPPVSTQTPCLTLYPLSQMDHDPRNPTYIASQGPLASTVADFWQVKLYSPSILHRVICLCLQLWGKNHSRGTLRLTQRFDLVYQLVSVQEGSVWNEVEHKETKRICTFSVSYTVTEDILISSILKFI